METQIHWIPSKISLRRSRHKVTGLEGLCALGTQEVENLAIMPTTAPCNSTPWTAAERRYEISEDSLLAEKP
jgi:hypothetical protein